jgi:hypothetical protein
MMDSFGEGNLTPCFTKDRISRVTERLISEERLSSVEVFEFGGNGKLNAVHNCTHYHLCVKVCIAIKPAARVMNIVYTVYETNE